MITCANCGTVLDKGLSFCTNCGTPVAVADMVMSSPSDADEPGVLGAALASAVEANEQVVDVFESHAAVHDDKAARWAEAEASAAEAAPYVAPSSNDAPQAPAGFSASQSQSVPGAVPFYQQDVSPNAHYSSARTYEQGAYGTDTGQQGYRQPSYGTQAGATTTQAASEQVWPAQTATHRAFAMTLYVSGLIGLIFGLVVRDKDDAFITHHLNNCTVLVIGSAIGSFLSAVGIGVLLLIYLLVMAIMGIVSAYNGDMKELPLIGKIHIIK